MDDDDQEAHSNIGLGLGLSVGGYYSTHAPRTQTTYGLDLSFSPHPKDEPVYYKPDGSRSSPRTTDDEADVTNSGHNDNPSRKKLRLTKEQSSLLENSFKLHTTLNPVQKQTLAEQLNLKPRQVEVWFQNRRARTKLKQTEVDCEFLKRCCEGLSDENRRLKKQLQELKATPSPPLYLHRQNATMCPSCQRVTGSDPEDQ